MCAYVYQPIYFGPSLDYLVVIVTNVKNFVISYWSILFRE